MKEVSKIFTGLTFTPLIFQRAYPFPLLELAPFQENLKVAEVSQGQSLHLSR